MGPKLLAETADMIGVKELRDAFKEVREDFKNLLCKPITFYEKVLLILIVFIFLV